MPRLCLRMVPVILPLFVVSSLGAEELAVRGRVLDPAGDPVSECRVLLVPVPARIDQARSELEGQPEPESLPSSLTDREGFFRVVAPEVGMWAVRAQAPGFVPMEFRLVPLTEEYTLPTVLLPRDVGLFVRVLGPDRRPVAGGRVRLEPAIPARSKDWEPSQWQPARRLASADENGNVTLARSDEENLVVRTFAPGYLEAATAVGRRRRVSVTLAEGVPRAVEVTDPRGRPAAGVVAWIGKGAWAVGPTGAHGRLSVHLPRGRDVELELRAEAGDHAALRLTGPTAEEPEETRPVAVRLMPPTAVRGRLVDRYRRSAVAEGLVWLETDPGSFRRTDATGSYQLLSSGQSVNQLFAAAPSYFVERLYLGLVAGEAMEASTLAMTPKLAASGVVVDEAGKPLLEVAIRARYDPAQMRYLRHLWISGGHFTSSAGGRFRIGNLVAGIAYKLRFLKEGFAPTEIDLPSRDLDQPAPSLRVVMRAGRTVTGLVVADDSTPIAGALVTLRPPLSDDLPTRIDQRYSPETVLTFAATTDAGGEYSIADLPAGRFLLEVEAYGFASLIVPGVEVPESPGVSDLGTVMLAPGAVVEGRVVGSDDEPLAGVDVRVVPPDPEGEEDILVTPDLAPLAAVTDAGGRFALTDLDRGEIVKLVLRRSGFSRVVVAGIEAPTAEPVEVVMQPTSRLEGRVVTAGGQPVAGVSVELMQPILTPTFVNYIEEPLHAISDDEGSFVFEGIKAGPAQLGASARGYQTPPWQRLDFEPGKDQEGIEIVLNPGATISGTVFSPAGESVIGATVQLLTAHESAARRAPLSLPVINRTGSSGDGRYRLEGVPPGRVAVAAVHDRYGRVVRDLEVVLGENQLDLQFEGGYELTGRVVDELGQPVPGAAIELFFRRVNWEFRQSFSDDGGAFKFVGLPAGSYRLSARKKGYAKLRELMTVTIDQGSVNGFEVTLRAGGAITGKLIGIDLQDLDGVEIRAGDLAVGEASYDLTYRIPDLPPGEWTVTARLPRTGRQSQGHVTLESGEPEATLDLVFESGLALEGVVYYNQIPLPGAQISLRGIDVAVNTWGETTVQGAFRLDGLSSGEYQLRVLHLGTGLRHAETLEISADQSMTLDIAVGTVSGSVVDGYNSLPLLGATLLLVPENSDAIADRRLAQSDPHGLFRFKEVPAGRWRLLCRKPGYAEAQATVAVEPGSEVNDLDFELEATEGMRLEVSLASGRFPESVHVAVLDASGRVFSGGTYAVGENGKVRLTTVPQGIWQVLVGTEGAATVARRPVSTEEATAFLLPPAGSLDVTVQELVGSDELATLTLAGADGRRCRMVVSGGRLVDQWPVQYGRALVEGLPEGEWLLRVDTKSGRSWSRRAGTLQGAVTSIVIESSQGN